MTKPCSACGGKKTSGVIKTYDPITGKTVSKKPVPCRTCAGGAS